MGSKGAKAVCKASGKIAGLNPAEPFELENLSIFEVSGIRGVAVKCIDITKNSDCEGSLPGCY